MGLDCYIYRVSRVPDEFVQSIGTPKLSELESLWEKYTDGPGDIVKMSKDVYEDTWILDAGSPVPIGREIEMLAEYWDMRKIRENWKIPDDYVNDGWGGGPGYSELDFSNQSSEEYDCIHVKIPDKRSENYTLRRVEPFLCWVEEELLYWRKNYAFRAICIQHFMTKYPSLFQSRDNMNSVYLPMDDFLMNLVIHPEKMLDAVEFSEDWKPWADKGDYVESHEIPDEDLEKLKTADMSALYVYLDW